MLYSDKFVNNENRKILYKENIKHITNRLKYMGLFYYSNNNFKFFNKLFPNLINYNIINKKINKSWAGNLYLINKIH